MYFPLKNASDKFIGYRKIEAGREEEAESHGHHTAGLFWCKAHRVGHNAQAVLVPSVHDVLHLAAHKIPGWY